jgi:hypothetical protein
MNHKFKTLYTIDGSRKIAQIFMDGNSSKIYTNDEVRSTTHRFIIRAVGNPEYSKKGKLKTEQNESFRNGKGRN